MSQNHGCVAILPFKSLAIEFTVETSSGHDCPNCAPALGGKDLISYSEQDGRVVSLDLRCHACAHTWTLHPASATIHHPETMFFVVAHRNERTVLFLGATADYRTLDQLTADHQLEDAIGHALCTQNGPNGLLGLRCQILRPAGSIWVMVEQTVAMLIPEQDMRNVLLELGCKVPRFVHGPGDN